MVGRQLGHYKIIEKLGAGGMGEVYRAEDTILDREVALKVLPPELAESQERLDRFQREAKTLATLNHPNIVHVYTVEEDEGTHFLTMELVEGKRLSELIPKGGMTLERIFEIAIPLADALSAAHDKGVIHRDLKPANIMLSEEGRVKVLDFGLAKLREPASPAEATALPTEPLTEEGRILGTIPYMSPEQLEGKELDSRSDIFSLGVVLYEMATGERPFKGDSSASLVTAIMSHSPQEVDSLRADLPHHLGRIIRHCLEKDPRRRYQSALDVHNELQDLHREESFSVAVAVTLESKPESTQRPIRWPPVAAVAGAAIVLAALGALWLGRSETPTEPPTEAPAELAKAVEGQPPMIVVLPFENLGDPEDEYFADGMTEEITSRLAVVSELRVISRTSAMQYKENRPSLKQVGQELGVDYVLEGSVRWARADGGNRVRITPQLIRVADDSHLWADSYDRVIEDVFEIQSDIASQVIDQLAVTLGEGERVEVEARPTENLEAYQAYLRGLDYYENFVGWSRGDLERAIKLFERAVELDPEFVPAYYRSARAHLLIHWGIEPSSERVTLAKAAAERALALAPDDPEAHLAMGYYHYYGRYNFEAARAEFETARQNRPNDPEVLSAVAQIDRRQGRWEEALERFQTALKLDPLSANRTFEVGATLQNLRRFEEARGFFERVITLAPERQGGYERLVDTYWGEGDLNQARAVLDAMPRQDTASSIEFWYWQEVYERRYPEALERLRSGPEMFSLHMPRALLEGHVYQLVGDPARSRAAYEVARHQLEEVLKQEAPDSWWAYCWLGEALAGLGRNDEALRAAARASELYPISRDAVGGPLLGTYVARVYASAGEHEAALDQVEYLLSIPGRGLENVWLDPLWDPLRDDPRFQALLEKYGQEAG